MKKLAIIIAAAVAAFAFSSCNKIDNAAEENSGIKFNITVANPGGSDTKAVKTGWTNGDKINIWFDSHATATPDLVITYNGTSWIASELSSTVKDGLIIGNTGTMVYFYEGGNDLSYFTNNHYSSTSHTFSAPYGSSPEEFYAPTLMLSSHGGGGTNYSAMNYAYDGTELTLNLNRWGYITNIQVVVTGLSGNPEDWYLYGDDYDIADQWNSIQDFRLRDGGVSHGFSSKYSRGTDNAEGVAFYFREASPKYYNNVGFTTHNLILTNGTDTYKFKKTGFQFTSAYKTANPSADSNLILDNTFIAIKVAFSKFD